MMSLVFFVNGRKIKIAEPNPESTLLHYLRRTLYLTGTKEGCGQGGCGACTVMVSYYSIAEDRIIHFSTNACIIPLCYLHGMAVTTVEGIGSTRDGLHAVQKSLVDSHGLQCGFCTPGMVMTMYTLYRNTPNPKQEDMERVLEGNLCRCTGYRPILEAFKKSCPCGLGLCQKNEDDKEESSSDTSQSQVQNDSNDEKSSNYDQTQDVIFPSELQMLIVEKHLQYIQEKLDREKYNGSVEFCMAPYTWRRPSSLAEVLDIKEKNPDAVVVMGCTYIGYQIKKKLLKSDTILCCTHVKELQIVQCDGDSITIGSAVTFASLERKLKELFENFTECQKRSVSAILSCIRWIGADQIRNIATIGGHLMSRAPNHDLQTLLMAMGAELSFVDAGKKTVKCKLDNSFISNGRRDPGSSDILVSVTIPLVKENEHVVFFKQPHRRGFDYAIVNAGMFVSFTDTDKVQDIRLCFGNIDKRPRNVEKIQEIAKNQNWDDDLVTRISATLIEELKDSSHDNLQYRLTLVCSFFFKFFLKVQGILGNKQEMSCELEQVPSTGSHFYDFPDPDGNHVVWKPIPHTSAPSITAGEAVYVDDMPTYTNELFTKFVGSTKSHAKILSVDPTDALKVPGVVDYISKKDVPGKQKYGLACLDEELFADGEVRCYGQPIGAIIAETREIARHAAKLVKVEYEELPAVYTVEQAMTEKSFYDYTNCVKQGDVEKGLKDSDITIEGVVATSAQEHFYMEPQSVLVVPKREQKEVDIFATSQWTTLIQNQVGQFLNIPRNRVVVKVKRVGGGFGGKVTTPILISGITAVAAWKTNRPVRCTYEREEDIRLRGKRTGFKAYYKAGVSKYGTINALSIEFYCNAGYTHDSSTMILDFSLLFLPGCYNIPNFYANGHLCKTNIPSSTACRGFAGPQGHFIIETIVNDIAERVGMQQHMVKEINMYQEGHTTIHKKKLTDFNLVRCWKECKAQSNYEERRTKVQEFNRASKFKKRGLAMSPLMYPLGNPFIQCDQAGALVHVYLDGSVLIAHGGVEIGQGIHTKMCQVAATALQIPIEKLFISETSTNTVPNATETGGSFAGDLNAGAVLNACLIINERLEPFKKKKPDGTWEEWVNAAYNSRVSLSTTGYYKPRDEGYNFKTQMGDHCLYFTFGTACSEVEIDCLTGEHQILRTDIVIDVGKSLNPAIDIGQIEGGFVMGSGMMTSEQVTIKPSGQVENFGPINYKIPGIRNIPREFKITLLKEAEGGKAVYSSKGVGEPPLLLAVSVHFALKDAIYSARKENGNTDFFRLECPATPDRIRMACMDDISQKCMGINEKTTRILI